jgi:Tfp pilus assembly protein FimT
MTDCGRSRGAVGRLAPAAPGEHGLTTVDLVIALAVIVLVGGLVMPATASVIDASRARHAAGFMSTHFRLARLQALARTRAVGLVFDLVHGRWTFRVCSDGNGNGLRRADLTADVDPCAPEVHDVAQLLSCSCERSRSCP